MLNMLKSTSYASTDSETDDDDTGQYLKIQML